MKKITTELLDFIGGEEVITKYEIAIRPDNFQPEITIFLNGKRACRFSGQNDWTIIDWREIDRDTLAGMLMIEVKHLDPLLNDLEDMYS